MGTLAPKNLSPLEMTKLGFSTLASASHFTGLLTARHSDSF